MEEGSVQSVPLGGGQFRVARGRTGIQWPTGKWTIQSGQLYLLLFWSSACHGAAECDVAGGDG